MAKKIDLKSLDWASILIDAVVQTQRSVQEKRREGPTRPDLGEVFRAYQAEEDYEEEDAEDEDYEEEDAEDEEDEEDDYEGAEEDEEDEEAADDGSDLDEERDGLDLDTEEPWRGRRSGGQEGNSELECLRVLVDSLRERLAAAEALRKRESALVESTMREYVERERGFAARERELMGLLGEALRCTAVVREPSGDTAQPAPQATKAGEVVAKSPTRPEEDDGLTPAGDRGDADSELDADDYAGVARGGEDIRRAGSATPDPPKALDDANALPVGEDAGSLPSRALAPDSEVLQADLLGRADGVFELRGIDASAKEGADGDGRGHDPRRVLRRSPRFRRVAQERRQKRPQSSYRDDRPAQRGLQTRECAGPRAVPGDDEASPGCQSSYRDDRPAQRGLQTRDCAGPRPVPGDDVASLGCQEATASLRGAHLRGQG